MASDEMIRLCSVRAEGLFPIANCANHSCDPNIISSSSSNTHLMSFISLRPIKEGDVNTDSI